MATVPSIELDLDLRVTERTHAILIALGWTPPGEHARAEKRVRDQLAVAWPELTDDPTYLGQLAAVATRAALNHPDTDPPPELPRISHPDIGNLP